MKALLEILKALYSIKDAISNKKNNSSDEGEGDNVNYTKFIQPVGIIHVIKDTPVTETGDIPENLGIKSIVIDEYRQEPIDDYGRFGDMKNSYMLIYNRADVENNTNNKFEYGHYTTVNNKRFNIYINYDDIKDTISIKELLSMYKPVVNPKFDEINVSDITESNLEDFVVINVDFPDYR